jgi:adenylosuccinate lyase
METISPLDGRYREKTRELTKYFSEEAQLKLKTEIEIDYFLALAEELKLGLSKEEIRLVKQVKETTLPDYIQSLEKKTRHDIKAIELYIRESFDMQGIPQYKEYIHFGLTSQDINSIATSRTIREFDNKFLVKEFHALKKEMMKFSERCDVVIPARTHGQAAVPTLLKKEIEVFIYRLQEQFEKLFVHTFKAKFGGAVGNMNAHNLAYPDHDWNKFAESFCNSYGLFRSELTTQVDNNDWLAEYFATVVRINNILINFSRDIWMYTSYGYFKKSVKPEEVGSSTMPQKINPIEFENAEGNLEYANAILNFMSSKLQVSRLQRDLSDSTVVRNLGVPFGHVVLAAKNIVDGLKKLQINEENIQKDLEKYPELVAEGIQTLLRKENVKDAYSLIKDVTRGATLTAEKLKNTLENLNISDTIKEKILSLKVSDYIGKTVNVKKNLRT